ncbi:hypothetical protein VPH35_099330 [Triticum aestivum]|uniref:Uncharacterized protein n=2 Tax=Aegilops tauschii TaxID=37682 RepID=M8BZC3_AEGTA
MDAYPCSFLGSKFRDDSFSRRKYSHKLIHDCKYPSVHHNAGIWVHHNAREGLITFSALPVSLYSDELFIHPWLSIGIIIVDHVMQGQCDPPVVTAYKAEFLLGHHQELAQDRGAEPKKTRRTSHGQCQEACPTGNEVAEHGGYWEEEDHPDYNGEKSRCRMPRGDLSDGLTVKGHCMVYTSDGSRFEVPLEYLSTAVFGELLRMSQEEFGFAGGDDGRITLPCDTAVMEYAMCLLRRDASTEVVMAFLSSIARPCCFDGGVVVPCVGLNHYVGVC